PRREDLAVPPVEPRRLPRHHQRDEPQEPGGDRLRLSLSRIDPGHELSDLPDHRSARHMVKPVVVTLALAVAGCGSFQDPDIVIDFRVLALSASVPEQIVDIDIANPA